MSRATRLAAVKEGAENYVRVHSLGFVGSILCSEELLAQRIIDAVSNARAAREARSDPALEVHKLFDKRDGTAAVKCRI